MSSIQAIESEINTIKNSISEYDRLLKNPFGNWPEDDRNMWGDQAGLRSERKRLGERMSQLQEEINILLKSKSLKSGSSNMSYWQISGRIKNALGTPSCLQDLYRIASRCLGYYDGGDQAFFYDADDLILKVLFESKKYALKFENQIQMIYSAPINGLDVSTEVSEVNRDNITRRVFAKHYHDTQNAAQVLACCNPPTLFRISSEIFTYQSIEKSSLFSEFVKAEACQLIPSSFCKSQPTYSIYDGDENNRLSLSREFHGWYDALNSDFPIVNLKPLTISENPDPNGRYKVSLVVEAFDIHHTQIIFSRLKEETTKTVNELQMVTFVNVRNPKIFNTCLEWKATFIDKIWKEKRGSNILC